MVFGDRHAKINLIGSDGESELIRAESIKRNQVRRAMQIATEEHVEFLAQ